MDYLKYDWCMAGDQHAPTSYYIMSRALQESGRDIVFSICEWGNSKPWLWGPQVGNLWRTTGDIYDAWEGVKDYSLGMMNIVDKNAELHPYAGPGHWNDPDMLEVGNGGMTTEEYRSHFSLWAMLAAPLIAGNDIANMDADTKAILTNREVIAIDQDALGVQGRRISKQGALEVWSRPLDGGGRAVVLLNRGEAPATIRVTWDQLDYPAGLKVRVRDLWAGRDLGVSRNGHEAAVAPHGVVMLMVKPQV